MGMMRSISCNLSMAEEEEEGARSSSTIKYVVVL